MKYQIRNNVFETNSSSTHSICICKDDVQLRFPDKVIFKYGEFGWEIAKLDSVEDKASYLFTALFYIFDEDPNKYLKYIRFIFETLRKNEVDCEFSGDIIVSTSTSWDKSSVRLYSRIDGYIDHGNEVVELVDTLCTDEQLLLSFLFTKKSFILTGNDNDDQDVDIKVDYPHVEIYKGN